MRKLAMIALATSLSSWLSGPSEALEFTADRWTRTQQGLHHTRIFYRDHMWRLEHNEAPARSASPLSGKTEVKYGISSPRRIMSKLWRSTATMFFIQTRASTRRHRGKRLERDLRRPSDYLV